MPPRKRGWTPSPASTEPPPPPAPSPRRRRRPAPSETPLVDAMAEASPREYTGARPPGGKHGVIETTQIRVRLGQRWSGIVTAVKTGEYTWQEFVDGLSEEELARGQLRGEDGTFTGRPPSFVPREFLLACQREQKRRFEEIFGSEVLGIAQSYVELCKNSDIPAKDRAKMMQYAMERIFGGIPKDIRVSQEQPWESMVVNVVSQGDEGMPEHRQRRYEGYQERMGD